jgi:hypothetical protein
MPLNVDKISTGSLSVNGTEITGNAPYKVYTALLTQFLQDAPTPTVLENTIGNIIWSFDSFGVYYGTLTGAFPANKTFLQGPIGSSGKIYGTAAYSDDFTNQGTFIMVTRENDNQIRITSLLNPEQLSDGLLTDFPIEIRVYE